MEKIILTQITNDELEKCRLNILRYANRDVAPIRSFEILVNLDTFVAFFT